MGPQEFRLAADGQSSIEELIKQTGRYLGNARVARELRERRHRRWKMGLVLDAVHCPWQYC